MLFLLFWLLWLLLLLLLAYWGECADCCWLSASQLQGWSRCIGDMFREVKQGASTSPSALQWFFIAVVDFFHCFFWSRRIITTTRRILSILQVQLIFIPSSSQIGVGDACFFNDAMFYWCFKKWQNIMQTMHIDDVFAKNSKMRKKPYIEQDPG